MQSSRPLLRKRIPTESHAASSPRKKRFAGLRRQRKGRRGKRYYPSRGAPTCREKITIRIDSGLNRNSSRKHLLPIRVSRDNHSQNEPTRLVPDTDNHRTGTARIVLRSAPRIPPYPERQENAAPFAGTTIRRMSRYGSCPDTNLPENGNPASAGIYARSERGTKKGPIRHRSLSLFH